MIVKQGEFTITETTQRLYPEMGKGYYSASTKDITIEQESFSVSIFGNDGNNPFKLGERIRITIERVEL